MKIIIDLDNTVIDSTHTILNIYNHIHNTNILYHNNSQWNFKGLIPNPDINEILSYFESDFFYDKKFLVEEPSAIKIINKLAEKNEVIICSKHSEVRIPKTKRWIETTFGGKVGFIAVESFNKSVVGECDIFIDDRIDALESVLNLAKKRVCYKNYDWNKEWEGERAFSWKDIISLVTMRSALRGIRTVIIDPENEYQKLADALNVPYIELSTNSTTYINLFDIEEKDILDDNMSNGEKI